MKIYKIAGDGTILRYKDPQEEAKAERRREMEKIGKAMLYLRELSRIMLEMDMQIPPMENGEPFMRLITDLMAMFRQIQSRLMTAGV